jgi:hypothetical protein
MKDPANGGRNARRSPPLSPMGRYFVNLKNA